MRRPLGFLANLLGEGVAEAALESLIWAVLAGPLWIVKHFFGPFHLTDDFVLGVGFVAGFLGLVIFVAIGVSRHPEAWKVRLFGAVVAAVLAAGALYRLVVPRRV